MYPKILLPVKLTNFIHLFFKHHCRNEKSHHTSVHCFQIYQFMHLLICEIWSLRNSKNIIADNNEENMEWIGMLPSRIQQFLGLLSRLILMTYPRWSVITCHFLRIIKTKIINFRNSMIKCVSVGRSCFWATGMSFQRKRGQSLWWLNNKNSPKMTKRE